MKNLWRFPFEYIVKADVRKFEEKQARCNAQYKITCNEVIKGSLF